MSIELPQELELLQIQAEEGLNRMGMECLIHASRSLMDVLWVTSARHRWPEDGGMAHEWWTQRDAVEIMAHAGEDPVFERTPFTAGEVRIVLAFVAIHDMVSIKKITEQHVRDAGEEEQPRLRQLREDGRRRHMAGVREIAQVILPLITENGSPVFSENEMSAVTEIGTHHDDRKLSVPIAYPPLLGQTPTTRAAIAAVEADIIWPVTGTIDPSLRMTCGPVADIRRRRAITLNDPAASVYEPTDDELIEQARANLETQLCPIPVGWDPGPNGLYRGTLVRTLGGAMLLERYLQVWGL